MRRSVWTALLAERTAAVGEAVRDKVDGLDPVVAEIIARGCEYSAVDAYQAEYEVARLRASTAPIWQSVDVIALPTTPDVASLASVDLDPYGPNEMMGRLTTFVNVLDLMSVVVPITGNSSGPPAGLQLIGPAWHDGEIERLAAGFETGRTATAQPAPCTVVVVGAHLAGLPLNHQLTDRGATLVAAGRTRPEYRLYALSGMEPAKPGLLRVDPSTGAEIEIEGGRWSPPSSASSSIRCRRRSASGPCISPTGRPTTDFSANPAAWWALRTSPTSAAGGPTWLRNAAPVVVDSATTSSRPMSGVRSCRPARVTVWRA